MYCRMSCQPACHACLARRQMQASTTALPSLLLLFLLFWADVRCLVCTLYWYSARPFLGQQESRQATSCPFWLIWGNSVTEQRKPKRPSTREGGSVCSSVLGHCFASGPVRDAL
ncbi:hypothetical protein F5144DRAFT_351257 [Chaetomium tenue]|uniref:Uncharacterized protein n=1 Tax=Chaetomium tenue TaxID=1854479 RepID=A0ACB7NXR4_9PEZI|nr:hypothetical protein F5144DRAFT_351257 [Chaetomium globosum]